MSHYPSYTSQSQDSWMLEEQPHHKLLQRGISALTDAEILSLVICPQNATCIGIELAKKLLAELQGLAGIARASTENLTRIKGIDISQAISIRAAFELSKRKETQNTRGKQLNSAEAVFQFLGPRLADLDHEVFYVLYLNRNHELKVAKQLFEGGVHATVIDTRIIFKEAINQLASSIILVHNHPSNNLQPSQADRKITKKCKEAGKLFDIAVLDHIIVTSKGYHSFANEGEM